MARHKILLLFMLILLSTEQLIAEGFIEFRPTLFLPASNRTRKVFGHGLYENQIEAGYWSYPDWTVWGNVSYMQASGEIETSGNTIDISTVNISGGASYHFPLYLKCPGWNGYLGAGPVWGRIKCDRIRSTLGGVVKFGSFYKFHPWGHMNVFCDYMQLVYQFHSIDDSGKGNITTSGFRLGIALAFEF